MKMAMPLKLLLQSRNIKIRVCCRQLFMQLCLMKPAGRLAAVRLPIFIPNLFSLALGKMAGGITR